MTKVSQKVALVLGLLPCACGNSYAQQSGADQPLMVEYEQTLADGKHVVAGEFFEGDFQAGEDGPELKALVSQNPTVTAGGPVRSLVGDAGPDAYTIALRLKDAGTGYFLIKVDQPDLNVLPYLGWTALLHFKSTAPLGEHSLIAAAFDSEGRAGPLAERTFNIQSEVPEGDTVISLIWDTAADLDIHVTAPSGKELDPKHFNTGQVPDDYRTTNPPTPISGSGQLDRDANAGCVFDGAMRENVVFSDSPDPGLYQIRVDEFSACGVAATTFRVEIYHEGVLTEPPIVGQLLELNADGGDGSGMFVAERTF